MSSVATETTVVHPPGRFAQASRSPVLSQFRTNPFRVLRVPPDMGIKRRSGSQRRRSRGFAPGLRLRRRAHSLAA